MKTRKGGYKPNIGDRVIYNGLTAVVTGIITPSRVRLDIGETANSDELQFVPTSFRSPALTTRDFDGGKKRKSNKWLDRSYLAVIGTSMAFDDNSTVNEPIETGQYLQNEGGKRIRKLRRSRKKPHGLKKRIR